MSLPGRVWDGLRHPTVRLKLTAIYAGIFALCSVALIIVNFALTAAQAVTATINTQDPQAAVSLVHTQVLGILFWSGPIALVITLCFAVLLSWIAAGRALAPLRSITATAKRLSQENMDERIALKGPRDELHDLADTLDAMLERLSTAFEAQKRFVANASHELRTPLTRERALVDVTLADQDASVTSLRAMAERVRVAVDEQERLIDGLLALARGERGIDRFETVDLADLAARAIDAAVELSGHAHGIRITRSLASARVQGDPELLERLAFNLVDNALTYNVEGGWVEVRTSEAGDVAILQVANGGQVVPHEVVPVLFEAFRRRGTDRTGERRGNGLGLSIVAAVAAAHGGTVRAEPGAEGGLRVVVALPRAGDAQVSGGS